MSEDKKQSEKERVAEMWSVRFKPDRWTFGKKKKVEKEEENAK